MLRIVLAIVLLFLPLASAEAAKKKQSQPDWDLPMIFTHVRSIGGCEPVCAEWIAAEGKFTPGTSARFKAFLKTIGKRQLPLVILSPGGDVTSAIAIGRLIRERKMDVAVGGTVYAGCNPRDNACKLPKAQKGVYRGRVQIDRAFCNSACPVAFSGGVHRLTGTSASIGVHQVTTTWTNEKVLYRETYKIVKGKKKVVSRKEISRKRLKSKVTNGMYKSLRKKLSGYYKDMGIDPKVIDEAEKTPPSRIAWLPLAALQNFRLVTSKDDALTLAGDRICKVVAMPKNCVFVSPPGKTN